MTYIPYGRQLIEDDDIEAVIEVLRSPYLTQGPMVPNFEKDLGYFMDTPNVTAVSSATAALHLAYRAAGLGSGDLLWTSPISFVATANAALMCNAGVDFVDIDPISWNLCPQALEEKLKSARRINRLPKLLAPVHFSGRPADLFALQRLSAEFGFEIIEDGAHAIGAKYQGNRIGSALYSLATILSFHPVKVITTGEGGVICTRSDDFSRKVSLLRSHGITRERSRLQNQQFPDWYYEMIDLGYNYRLTDFQAALGRMQLKKIERFVARRRELAERYFKAFNGMPIALPLADDENHQSAWHLFVVRVQGARDLIFNALKEAAIGVNVHYIPIYLHPFYSRLGFKPGYCPNAEKYYKEAITLPLHPSLSNEQLDYIVDKFKHALETYS